VLHTWNEIRDLRDKGPGEATYADLKVWTGNEKPQKGSNPKEVLFNLQSRNPPLEAHLPASVAYNRRRAMDTKV